MKKQFKILISLAIVLIVGLIVLIIAISIGNKKEMRFLVLSKHHSLIYEDRPTMDLSIYASSIDHYYLKDENINQVLLYNESDSYNFVVDTFTKGVKSLVKDHTEYYEYILTGHLDVESADLITLNDAYVKIIYQNDYLFDLKIGNIAFQKLKTATDIQIKKVQSIVTMVDDCTTLSAILLNINARDLPLTINNIQTISSSLSINNDYIKIFDGICEIDNSIDVKELFGDTFDNFNQSTKNFKKIDLTKDSITLIIPLTYTSNEFVDNCGLLIEYTINNELYEEIINPYVLFKTTDNDRFLYQYEPTQD